MNIVRTAEPTDQAITVSDIKLHARILQSVEDSLINDYILAAQDVVEGLVRRSLMPQSWECKLDTFPVCNSPKCSNYAPPFGFYGGAAGADFYYGRRSSSFCEHIGIVLPRPPIISVESVTYTNTTGDVVTMAEGTDYVISLTSDPPRIFPPFGQSWPVHRHFVDSIAINYSAGYDNEVPNRVMPQAIKQAIRVMVAAYYENREAVTTTGTALSELPPPLTVTTLLRRHTAWSL